MEGARVVVVGAGFIGSEVASTCAALGCQVTVLEVMDVPLSNVLGPVVGAHCASLHGANGVDAADRGRVGADRARGGGTGPARVRVGRLSVHLRDGEVFDADVVVVGIGVSPSTGWLETSGLTVDNGVVCDDRLFAADGIVAAGDMARWLWRHDGSEELIRIEHWEVAANAGAAAARSLLAGRTDAPSFAPIPYFWSDQYGIRIQVLGNPGGDDEMVITEGSFEEGKFRRRLRPWRAPARRDGHRQAAPADGLPASAAERGQLRRSAGARALLRGERARRQQPRAKFSLRCERKNRTALLQRRHAFRTMQWSSKRGLRFRRLSGLGGSRASADKAEKGEFRDLISS